MAVIPVNEPTVKDLVKEINNLRKEIRALDAKLSSMKRNQSGGVRIGRDEAFRNHPY